MHKNRETQEKSIVEGFNIIKSYKWSIIFITLLVTILAGIKAHLMPKYYKSTVTLEVKSDDSQSSGFSMAGAASLLLGGAGGGQATHDKDMILLKTFRTNKKVLDKVSDYEVRYFQVNDKYQTLEVDSNISIEITDIEILDVKKNGSRFMIKPISKTEYELCTIGSFSNPSLGIFHYSEIVTIESITLMVHKKTLYTKPYIVELAGTKRYIFENIIKNNLLIESDDVSPFLTLSYVDSIPKRGEKYLKHLIETYINQSISDVKDDTSLVLKSYQRQIKDVEEKITNSSKILEDFKRTNTIIAPEIQALALVEELSKVGIEIAQNDYKQDLLKNLIVFTKNNNDIDALSSSLIELQDLPNIELIKLIQEQELVVSELYMKYKMTHPSIIRAEKTIENLRHKVLLNLKNLLKTLNKKNNALQKMKKSYMIKLKGAPKQEQKLIKFSRNYQVNEKVYLFLMQKYSLAKLKHDKGLSKFKIIESIYTSHKHVKPKKALIVIVALLSALFLSIALAFFRHSLIKNDE